MFEHLQDIDPNAPHYDVYGVLERQARIQRELKRQFETPRQSGNRHHVLLGNGGLPENFNF